MDDNLYTMHGSSKYNLIVESFTLFTVPATYIAFKMGCSSTSTFIIITVAIFLSHIARLIILRSEYKPFSISDYVKGFVVPAAIITFVVVTTVIMLRSVLDNAYLRLIVVITISVLATGIFAFFIALTKNERKLMLSFIKALIKKSDK